MIAITKTSNGRLWIKPKSDCNSQYIYHACASVNGLDANLGTVTPVYCPDEDDYNQVVEVDIVQGLPSRPTLSITAYLSRQQVSILDEIRRKNSKFDLQIHYGSCTNPTDFDSYESILSIKDAVLTNYSIPQLTALQSEQRSAILENFTISFREEYKVFDYTINQINTVATDMSGFWSGNNNQCNDCEDDCQFAIITRSSGSITQSMFSTDGGITYSALANTNMPDNIGINPAKLVEYNGRLIQLITAVGGNTEIWVNDVNSVLNGSTNWVNIYQIFGSGIVILRNIYVFDNILYGLGESSGNSYVIQIDLKTNVVTELETGGATLPAGSARRADYYNNKLYVAGNDYLAKQSMSGFIVLPLPSGTTVNDFHIFSDGRIMVRTTTGWLMSYDDGQTWETTQTTIGFSTSGSELAMFNDDIGWTVELGRIWKTIDGGYTWNDKFQPSGLNKIIGIKTCDVNSLIIGDDAGSVVLYR